MTAHVELLRCFPGLGFAGEIPFGVLQGVDQFLVALPVLVILREEPGCEFRGALRINQSLLLLIQLVENIGQSEAGKRQIRIGFLQASFTGFEDAAEKWFGGLEFILQAQNDGDIVALSMVSAWSAPSRLSLAARTLR